MSTNPTMIGIREAARRLGVHENTIRRYADRGLLESVRLPSGVRRVRRADVEALDAAGAGTTDTLPPRPPLSRPSVSVAELVEQTGAEPIDDLAALSLPELWSSDEEVDEFVQATLAERERDR
jgi:excisionase family DNA binding protein